MAPKRPRISVGVMAVCCGVLSLSVVARESTSHGETDPRTDARKYVAAVHHRTVHPGSSALAPVADALEMVTTTATSPIAPVSIVEDTQRHRKTRETLPFPRSDSSIEESFTGRIKRLPAAEPRTLPSPLVFMPSRGRRFGGFEVPLDKRQLTIEQMLAKGDYFVPNRGKKAPAAGELIKKGTFDVLLGGGVGSQDEYFFPNRGKKQYLLAYDTGANVRPLPVSRGPTGIFEGKKDHVINPLGSLPQLQRPVESRLRRNLLENLANEHKDTFFSSRGKRVLSPSLAEDALLPPTRTLPVEQQQDERPQEYSAQPSDLEALFWAEDMLLPLELPTAS